MQQYLTNEEIIKKHADDWMQWHEKCREQVLSAMDEVAANAKKLCTHNAKKESEYFKDFNFCKDCNLLIRKHD